MCDRVRLSAIIAVGLVTLASIVGAAALSFAGRPDTAGLSQIAATGIGALGGLLAGRNGNGYNGPTILTK